MKKRDTQRQRVYDWETRLCRNHHRCVVCDGYEHEHKRQFVKSFGPPYDAGHFEEPKYDHEFRPQVEFAKLNVKLSLQECADLANKVRRDHGLGPVGMADGRRRRRSCYDPWRNTIRIIRAQRDVQTVLHEVAHSMVGSEFAWHGPEFARQALDLYNRYADVPLSVGRALAKQRRVKIASSKVSATALKRSELKRLADIEKELGEARAVAAKLDQRIAELAREARRIRGGTNHTKKGLLIA